MYRKVTTIVSNIKIIFMSKKKSTPILTYYDKRECVFCSEPIADQDRADKIHCEKQVINGEIVDCKTAKARVNDADMRQFFREHNAEIRAIDKRIGAMLKNKGEIVNFQDLEAYDIYLERAINTKLEKNGNFRCEYYLFSIDYNHIKKTFKLIKNG